MAVETEKENLNVLYVLVCYCVILDVSLLFQKLKRLFLLIFLIILSLCDVQFLNDYDITYCPEHVFYDVRVSMPHWNFFLLVMKFFHHIVFSIYLPDYMASAQHNS